MNGEGRQDTYLAAVEEMQATAKWIVGVFGVIGGVLAAGTQLSSIGELPLRDFRLWVAVASGAVALLLVGVVIWAGTCVLIRGHVTRDVLIGIHALRDRPWWRRWGGWSTTEIQRVTDPSVLDGHASIEELLRLYDETIAKRRQFDGLKERTESDIAREKELNENVAYLGAVVDNMTSAVRWVLVERLFRRAVRMMFGAGFLAAVAMGIFAWAANPPG